MTSANKARVNRAAPFIIAPLIGVLMFAAMATTQGVRFDYRAAPESRQHKYPDGAVTGFERGFAAPAGGAAFIERIGADAGRDMILVDVRFRKKEVETATADQIEDFRAYIYKENCRYLAENAFLEQGVTLKMRIRRPSGAILTSFSVNEEACVR
jgi:hypothetical protein